MKLETATILSFWFNHASNWFVKSDAFDEEIRAQFLPIYEHLAQQQLESLQGSAEDFLAMIIVLDQFSRNMFRNSAKMYAMDDKALGLCKIALEQGLDKQLTSFQQRQFMLMPLMHSESLDDQNRCVTEFEKLDNQQALKFAISHRDIVAQFGRFPHRNAILNRQSSAEEIAFVEEHGGF